MVASP